jgi:hypothetical protein
MLTPSVAAAEFIPATGEFSVERRGRIAYRRALCCAFVWVESRGENK